MIRLEILLAHDSRALKFGNEPRREPCTGSGTKAGNGGRATSGRKGHKKQLLTAKADGGPVILGNGGEIRSTRANATDPQGFEARRDYDEPTAANMPSGVARVRASLI